MHGSGNARPRSEVGSGSKSRPLITAAPLPNYIAPTAVDDVRLSCIPHVKIRYMALIISQVTMPLNIQ
ncbi:unnamed protein product [Colias eurytheme]|nr:unnamed protein product [Colias eurytheme]